jgi:hypothetical protein
VRGGFAALLGPFGGQPDTTVTLDSVRTSVEWVQVTAITPGAQRVDTLRTVHAVRSHHTLPGRDGWVSLAVGYHHSGAYRVDVDDSRGTLASTFPVGGFYVSAFFGPFRVWQASRSLFWYTTLGASMVQIAQANGISDDTLVRFDTERALAPEGSLLLGWRVHPGVRVIGGIGVQHNPLVVDPLPHAVRVAPARRCAAAAAGSPPAHVGAAQSGRELRRQRLVRKVVRSGSLVVPSGLCRNLSPIRSGISGGARSTPPMATGSSRTPQCRWEDRRPASACLAPFVRTCVR